MFKEKIISLRHLFSYTLIFVCLYIDSCPVLYGCQFSRDSYLFFVIWLVWVHRILWVQDVSSQFGGGISDEWNRNELRQPGFRPANQLWSFLVVLGRAVEWYFLSWSWWSSRIHFSRRPTATWCHLLDLWTEAGLVVASLSWFASTINMVKTQTTLFHKACQLIKGCRFRSSKTAIRASICLSSWFML